MGWDSFFSPLYKLNHHLKKLHFVFSQVIICTKRRIRRKKSGRRKILNRDRKAANNTKNIKSEENETKVREMLIHTALKSSVNSLFGRLWLVSQSGIFIP